MKRLFTLLLLYSFTLVPDAFAIDMGFNFRASSGFVTDGASHTYVLITDVFPTTRAGFTFGWNNASVGYGNAFHADRDSGVDVRLAGINYLVDNELDFKVTLPGAGDYSICLAMGDQSFGHTSSSYNAEIFDNVTSRGKLLNVVFPGPAAAHFFDATAVDRTTAAWPGSNVCTTKTFASTAFMLRLGIVGGGSNTETIAHLSITAAGGGGGGTPAAVGHRRIQ